MLDENPLLYFVCAAKLVRVQFYLYEIATQLVQIYILETKFFFWKFLEICTPKVLLVQLM